MSKMAIFVEGSTELNLLSSLIVAIGNESKLTVELRSQRGVKSGARSRVLGTLNKSQSSERFVTIIDCGGDSAVKSMMLDSYPNLTSHAGYSRILCVRDVYPTAVLNDISRLEAGLAKGVPVQPVVVDFILAVMECEAWIIAEHTHFQRLSSSLTCDFISKSLGFHPKDDDLQLLPNPASELEKCYALVGNSHRKGRSEELKLVDPAELYLSVAHRFSHLKRFCDIIDDFLS